MYGRVGQSRTNERKHYKKRWFVFFFIFFSVCVFLWVSKCIERLYKCVEAREINNKNNTKQKKNNKKTTRTFTGNARYAYMKKSCCCCCWSLFSSRSFRLVGSSLIYLLLRFFHHLFKLIVDCSRRSDKNMFEFISWLVFAAVCIVVAVFVQTQRICTAFSCTAQTPTKQQIIRK